jgi:RNA polymerase sigma factor (sigma-70 family)
MTDRQDLIRQAQTGDGLALHQLLVACQSDARRYARRHCLTSDVDDAVQEALLAITRHVASLKSAAAFAGWLFTIIRRECARLTRRILSHEDLDDDRIAAELARRPMDDLRADLAAALESLPAPYLQIVLLRDFEELTIAEISQALGLSVPAAKARLHRARHLVREYLVGPATDRSEPRVSDVLGD